MGQASGKHGRLEASDQPVELIAGGSGGGFCDMGLDRQPDAESGRVTMVSLWRRRLR
jgi:hypothetical protein